MRIKKIDKLFLEFPNLKCVELWLRSTVSSRNRHPIKGIYKRYTLRKPKLFDKAAGVIKNGSQDVFEILWARSYL